MVNNYKFVMGYDSTNKDQINVLDSCNSFGLYFVTFVIVLEHIRAFFVGGLRSSFLRARNKKTFSCLFSRAAHYLPKVKANQESCILKQVETVEENKTHLQKMKQKFILN